jgi:hypothetical protein
MVTFTMSNIICTFHGLHFSDKLVLKAGVSRFLHITHFKEVANCVFHVSDWVGVLIVFR